MLVISAAINRAKLPQLTLFPRWSRSIWITAWEQRKLSEVATFGGGHTPPMADPDNYEDGYVLWVTSQDVKSNYLDRTTTQITEKGAKELTLYPAGSLVMVTRSGILRHTLPVAELRKPSTVNQDIRVILPQSECCGEWLLQFFISHNKELLLEFGKTGTTVESVDFGKIKDMLLHMPSTVEQQQIGDYFAKLDRLITLHQRKCQYRGLYGYLSWEQRKLGELCTISKGHGYSKADIRDAGTPLILYGRLYTQYESRIENVDTFAVEQEGSLLSKGNEVIVPASGETAEDIAVASSVRRSGIIFGGDLNVVTPVSKLDPDYIALAITYSKAHDDLAKRAQGKSVVHVHGNDIAEVEIPYPSESEQKRISTVVLGLDNLITLHQ